MKLLVTWHQASQMADYAYSHALVSDCGCATWSQSWLFLGHDSILELWPAQKSFTSALRSQLHCATYENAGISEMEVACVMLRSMARLFDRAPESLSQRQKEAVMKATRSVSTSDKEACPACGSTEYEGKLIVCPDCESLMCSCCGLEDLGCILCCDLLA